MSNERREVRGAGVWLHKNGKFLLSQRTKKAGFGEWCPPGGHIEEGETPIVCAIREVMEEASVRVKDVRLITILEDLDADPEVKYTTYCFFAEWESGEPQPLEGECGEWSWFAWESLPSPIFRPSQLYVDKFPNPLEIS